MWSALGYGIAGLGAILAFLSYRLLLRPRAEKVPIYVFMAFSIVVIILGLGSELLKYHYVKRDKDAAALQNEYNSDAQAILGELDKLKTVVAACRAHGKAAAENYSNSSGCLMNGDYARGDGDNALTQLETVRGEVSKLVKH